MRVKLIEAETTTKSRFLDAWYSYESQAFSCPSLALPIVAAFFPSDMKVSFVDEKVDRLDLKEDVDAVAISFKSLAYRRAYEIADYYRARKVKVILGGVHASFFPKKRPGTLTV